MMETVLQVATAVGPGAAVALVAFYFIDKKDIRSSKTVANIVSSHRDDYKQMRADGEKSMKNITEVFSKNLNQIRAHHSEKSDDLVTAIRDLGERSECKYHQIVSVRQNKG